MKNPAFPDADPRCRRGARILDAQSMALEQRLDKNPADLEARLMLIGFYWRSGATQRRRRNDHILWLIEHEPQTPTRTYGIIIPEQAAFDYERGKTLWKQAMQTHPSEVTVATNSASFVLLFEPHLGEGWLLEAKVRNPTNTDWALALAGYYELQLPCESGAGARSMAERGLASYLEGFRLDRDDTRLDMIWNMRQLAAAAGFAEAVRVLRLADQARDVSAKQVEPAERDHWVHTARGLISMVRGDLRDAQEELRAAGRVTGSSTLPATSLASELLAAECHSAVLGYLRDCRERARPNIDLLSIWIEALENGQHPDLALKPSG